MFGWLLWGGLVLLVVLFLFVGLGGWCFNCLLLGCCAVLIVLVTLVLVCVVLVIC